MPIPASSPREDSHEVVPAEERDTPAILRLIEEAGWSYTREEIDRLIQLQPEGMLLLRTTGLRRTVIGCVYASCWGRLGFIGLMLVRGSHRSRGLGRRLMMEGLELLSRKGTRAVGLDAVAGAEEFYRNMGFRSEWESLRLTLETTKVEVPAPGLEVRRASARDMPAVLDLDRAHAAVDRGLVLTTLQGSEDAQVLVAGERDSLLAYGLLRRSKGCLRLGPVVASTGEPGDVAARAVVASAVQETYPRLLTVNVPGYHRAAVELMVSLGGERYPSCMRMYLGDPGRARAPEGVWALGAAEKG